MFVLIKIHVIEDLIKSSISSKLLSSHPLAVLRCGELVTRTWTLVPSLLLPCHLDHLAGATLHGCKMAIFLCCFLVFKSEKTFPSNCGQNCVIY